MGIKVERFIYFSRRTLKGTYEYELEKRLNEIEGDGHFVIGVSTRPGDADHLIIYREKEISVRKPGRKTSS